MWGASPASVPPKLQSLPRPLQPVVARLCGQPAVELRADEVLDGREDVAHRVVGPAVAVGPGGPRFPAEMFDAAAGRAAVVRSVDTGPADQDVGPGPPINVSSSSSSPAPLSRSLPRPPRIRSSPSPLCNLSSPTVPSSVCGAAVLESSGDESRLGPFPLLRDSLQVVGSLSRRFLRLQLGGFAVSSYVDVAERPGVLERRPVALR